MSDARDDSSKRPSSREHMPTLVDEKSASAMPTSQSKRDLLPLASRAFLDSLVRLQLLSPTSIHAFLEHHAGPLSRYTNAEAIGRDLVIAKYLTSFQLSQVIAGKTHGLVLGNHRILEPIGRGAMSEIFVAEHVFMKRRVAIKILPVDEDCPVNLLDRFYSEMRVLASLTHPHIVMAYDAGRLSPPHPNMPFMLYLAMELVSGGDLHRYVTDNGIVPIPQACALARQAASGLQEAHDHQLIHRDIKPSNLLLSTQGTVKLVDFGLARQFCSKLTDPNALLGTVEFMAPEQSRDASMVGSQADIYGLGATLFFLLTGEPPHPPGKTLSQALRQLQDTRPRRLRELRPDAPPQLEALIERMLDADPTRRPALPLTVMNALLPFTAEGSSSRASS